MVYEEAPLLSGYISEENLESLSNSAGIVVTSQGGGKVINMAQNPNFRAFWYGTNKIMANAIFFGNIIDGRSTQRKPNKKEE